MKCSVCGNELFYEKGMYVCKYCGASAVASHKNTTDVFICCTQVTRDGTMTSGSMMAHSLYIALKEQNINVFYSPEYFPEYPHDEQKSDFFVAMEEARIIIITGLEKNDFETALNYYGSRFRNKAILPVYSKISETDIVKVPGMLQPISYDSPDSIINVCREAKNTLSLLGNKENAEPEKDDMPQKKKNIGFILGLCLSFVAVIAIVVYFLFIGPSISDSEDYAKAQKCAKDGKYTEAMDIYYHLGNYKDSVDLLGKVYSKYNGFYRDEEKKLELDLNIVNSVGKIKINEYYGNKIISANASGKVKNNIIEFTYKDSMNHSGKGIIELFDDSLTLSINSSHSAADSLSALSVTFYLGKTAEPIFTADAKKLSKKDFLNWLNNSATTKDIKEKGYHINPADPEEKNSDRIYYVSGTDIVLEFKDSFEEAPLFAVYAPADIVVSGKIGDTYLPFEQNDVVFWPGENIYREKDDNFDIAEFQEDKKIRKTTTITVVTKKSYEKNYSWDKLLNAIFNVKLAHSVGSEEYVIASQNTEKYLISVDSGESLKFYAVDKNTFTSDYVTKIRYKPGISESDKYELWKENPELFEDFIDKKDEESRSSIYKVRKSANDEASQIGAFADIKNAKALADSKKDDGYKVYDEKGNLVYQP